MASSDEKDLEKGTSGRNSESDFSSGPSQRANPTPENKEIAQRQPSEQAAALEWDGADDTDNPLNWPRSKKIYHTIVPTGIATVATIASSIYTPGRDGVIQDLGVSEEVSILPFSLFVLGLAFGPMLGNDHLAI